MLLIISECNPEWSSVPLVGYNFFKAIDLKHDVLLVTHERNRSAIGARGHRNVVYISESTFYKKYYKAAASLSGSAWQVYHALTFPVHFAFSKKVARQFAEEIRSGKFDIVHTITPMLPRYPVATSSVCGQTPFVLGPVNGGVPYPPGFSEVARKEFAYLNFIRAIGRFLIPGYRATYRNAARVLAGSSYTRQFIIETLGVPGDKVKLVYENAVSDTFLQSGRQRVLGETLRLLFVGRLVPYKGADMVVDAVAALQPELRRRVTLTFVGDGEQRAELEQQVDARDLRERVRFTGWINSADTLGYYKEADIFCFPSVREFGGAVVMEAMSTGLPCIVVDNGGIGEYVTADSGFKIAPISRSHVVAELTRIISQLLMNPELLPQFSTRALARAASFTWTEKANEIDRIYADVLEHGAAK